MTNCIVPGENTDKLLVIAHSVMNGISLACVQYYVVRSKWLARNVRYINLHYCGCCMYKNLSFVIVLETADLFECFQS